VFCAVTCNSSKRQPLLLGNVSAQVTVGRPVACCVNQLTWPAMLTVHVCSCQEVKHHPASVDLELVKRLAATTATSNLQSFLFKEFSCISKEYAGRLKP
jgi:hypothetical protein